MQVSVSFRRTHRQVRGEGLRRLKRNEVCFHFSPPGAILYPRVAGGNWPKSQRKMGKHGKKSLIALQQCCEELKANPDMTTSEITMKYGHVGRYFRWADRIRAESFDTPRDRRIPHRCK